MNLIEKSICHEFQEFARINLLKKLELHRSNNICSISSKQKITKLQSSDNLCSQQFNLNTLKLQRSETINKTDYLSKQH